MIKRTQELALLKQYLNEASPVQCLLVYGSEGVGKTMLVKEFVSNIGSKVAYLDALHIAHDLTCLYDVLLAQIYDQSVQHCTDFAMFADQLNGSDHRQIYFIIDNAHLLSKEQQIIACLFKLQEFVAQRQISVVLISQLSWEAYGLTGLGLPHMIHLPDYQLHESLEILQLQFDKLYNSLDCKLVGYKQVFQLAYAQFCNLMYDNLLHINTRIPQLKYILSLIYPKYVEPLLDPVPDIRKLMDQSLDDETKFVRLSGRLLTRIKPYMRDVLNSVFLRDISCAEFNEMEHPNQLSRYISNQETKQLPLHSKYLLIASFLASYNPAKFDAKFFTKQSENKRQRNGGIKLNKRDERFTTLQTGPKSFEVDRMLAVFHAIVDDRVPPSVDLSQQVATLISLKMLTRCTVSLEKSLECMRLKVNVSLATMRRIADGIDFKLDHYLYTKCQ